jgi:hypothetical protein
MNPPRPKIKLEWLIIGGFLLMAIGGMLLLVYAMGKEMH